MSSLKELQAREQEVAREWQWLHDALNAIARVKAEHGDAEAFRLLQHQAIEVGQRRVELRMQMAALEHPQPGSQQGPENQRPTGIAASGS
jgi:hypothetical protein